MECVACLLVYFLYSSVYKNGLRCAFGFAKTKLVFMDFGIDNLRDAGVYGDRQDFVTKVKKGNRPIISRLLRRSLLVNNCKVSLMHFVRDVFALPDVIYL